MSEALQTMDMKTADTPIRGTTHDGPGPDGGASWHAMSAESVLSAMGSSKAGLSSRQAGRRLEQYGPNALPKAERKPKWRMMADQFASPLIIVLLVCVAVTLLISEWVDAAAIAVVLVVNAIIGYVQERKAQGAVDALAGLSAPEARVIRDGSPGVMVPASDVVPGDVVALESGDRVPADMRIISSTGLKVDESMLTGESDAARKDSSPVATGALLGDRSSMVFSGTMVESGRGTGVVVATGAGTELGEIGSLVSGRTDPTPLQRIVARAEKWISIIVCVVAVAVFAGDAILGGDLAQSFLSAVSLLVASMPESLPIILTVAMALGVKRMASAHALAKTLPAVETMGAVTVIGSDKTGTLTQNRMTVTRLALPDGSLEAMGEADGDPGIDRREDRWNATVTLLRAGTYANDATIGDDGHYQGDAVDAAMADASAAVLAESDPMQPGSQSIVAQTPYEPELLHAMAVHEIRLDDGQTVRRQYVKGAPDTIAAMCEHGSMGAEGERTFDKGMIDRQYLELAGVGLRVIAVAFRQLKPGDDGASYEDDADFRWLGMEGMMDPPRPGVETAIDDCRRAGVRVMMITGDHPHTATAIGRQIGLIPENEENPAAMTLTGAQMSDMSDRELKSRLPGTVVAARMSPQDKLRVVETLQDMGETVAVTGDGVNDAPALKRADVGVAMGLTGTDVAREAGDVVLTDDDFSTIVKAVRQGRVTFKAIRGAAYFLLSTAFAAMLAVAVNVMSDQPLLFLPLQMLWINMVTNGVQDIALGFEDGDGTELDMPPRSGSEGLLGRRLWARLAVSGLWMAVSVLAVFGLTLKHGAPVDQARTMALTALVLFNFFVAMSARSETRPIISLNPFGNPFLLIAGFAALGVHALAMYIPWSAALLGMAPLTGMQWLTCLGVGVTVLIVCEGAKIAGSVAVMLKSA